MEKSWTSHAEFLVLLITLLGGFYLLDGKIERSTASQSARTDRLYEMFCDSQKNFDQRFYELLRNQK